MNALYIISMLLSFGDEVINTFFGGDSYRHKLDKLRADIQNGVVDNQTALSKVMNDYNKVVSNLSVFSPSTQAKIQQTMKRLEDKSNSLEEKISSDTKKLNTLDAHYDEALQSKSTVVGKIKDFINGGTNKNVQEIQKIEQSIR